MTPSYLSKRSATVLFHSSCLRWCPTPFGLPQGSVLGPLLYILFTVDIGPLLASCYLASHSYADDVQSYKHCSASEAASAIQTMSQATNALNSWTSSNRLRLNPHKTQYIWLDTCQQLDKLDSESLSAEFPTFLFSTSVWDIGVILDQELSFAEHITALTRSYYYHWHQLWVVSRSLSSSSASILVRAFIANRLDYCSSLYCGLPQVLLQPLNGVLRAAARMIGGVPKFGHISDYMRDVLHWLPVQQRIQYRISSIVWHCVLGNTPSYLLELFILTSACSGHRSLRSASKGDFLVPRARTATRQKRASLIVGPSVWNDLPSELRFLPLDLSSSFYKLLKTLLFGRAWAGSASE